MNGRSAAASRQTGTPVAAPAARAEWLDGAVAPGYLRHAPKEASMAADRPRFPVKVSANGRYIVDQGGAPYFWLGTTQWELFRGYSMEDARTIIEG